MDIQQAAFNAGVTRGQLEDQMKRRSYSRQLERLAQSNPGALDAMLGGGRGGGGGSYSGGYGGGANDVMSANNPGGEMQRYATGLRRRVFEEDVRRSQDAETPPGYDAIHASKTPTREELNQQLRAKALAGYDENNAAMRDITARDMAGAYGKESGGAYGHGISTPGGKPNADINKALAAKMASGKAPKEKDYAELIALAETADNRAGTKGASQSLINHYKAQMSAPVNSGIGYLPGVEDYQGTVSKYVSDTGGGFMGGNTPEMEAAIMAKYGGGPTEVLPGHGYAPAALPEGKTKVVAGKTYAKVAGGWGLVD